VGALAYVAAGQELAGQLAAAGVRPATVLVAAGSGGTAAGLVVAGATSTNGTGWRVLAAAVSRPPDETAAALRWLAEAAAGRLGLPTPAPAAVLVHDARGPGYGVASAAGEQAAELAARAEGLLLDPVFSAKALGVLVTEPELPGPIVFWHTGGQVAALAHLMAQAREAVVG
jgi:D-cysteine desulfhydrase